MGLGAGVGRGEGEGVGFGVEVGLGFGDAATGVTDGAVDPFNDSRKSVVFLLAPAGDHKKAIVPYTASGKEITIISGRSQRGAANDPASTVSAPSQIRIITDIS